jgi:hypothetical protein
LAPTRTARASSPRAIAAMRREAAADAGMMVEKRDPVLLEQCAQAVGLAGSLGLGDAQEQLGDALLQPGRLDGGQRGQRLHQGLGRAARLGDHHESRAAEIVEGMQRGSERRPVEIVVEARARALLLRLVGGAGDVPPSELGQRLAAEARSADAEEDDGARAPGEACERRLGLGDVGAFLRHPEMRQAPAAMVLLEAGDGRLEPVQPMAELGL